MNKQENEISSYLENLKMSWFNTYLKRKWEWVDRNPRTAAWIGWFKGLFTGFLIYYFFIN